MSVGRYTVWRLTVMIVVALPVMAACQPGAPSVRITRITNSDVTDPNAHSMWPTMTGGGRYVSFGTSSTDVVAGYDEPAKWLYDVETGEYTVIGPQWEDADRRRSVVLSRDGTRMAVRYTHAPGDYAADAHAYVVDFDTRDTVFEPTPWPDVASELAWPEEIGLSADGRYLLVGTPNGSNYLSPEWRDADRTLIWFDTETGERRFVSDLGGLREPVEPATMWPVISGDGQTVVYAWLETTGLQRMHLRYLDLNVIGTQKLGQIGDLAIPIGAGAFGKFSITHDGNIVAVGTSGKRVPADTNTRFDVYLYYRDTETWERFATTADGRAVDGHCGNPKITPDGRYVAMTCYAENLDDLITHAARDVYVWDRECDTVARVTRSTSGGAGGDNNSGHLDISDDGQTIVFSSLASNLVPGDRNSAADIFIAENPLDDCLD